MSFQPLQIQTVDDPSIDVAHQFNIEKIDEFNQHTIMDQLYDRFAHFNLNGETIYDDMWDLSLEAIGIATPNQAFQVIRKIHQDHRGEAGNDQRYQENFDRFYELRNDNYVEVPVQEDLEDNTRLPNDLDIDKLYPADVLNIVDQLNQYLKDAYADYLKRHTTNHFQTK